MRPIRYIPHVLDPQVTLSNKVLSKVNSMYLALLKSKSRCYLPDIPIIQPQPAVKNYILITIGHFGFNPESDFNPNWYF